MIDYTLPLDRLPDPLPIEPLRKPFDVTITPPGSKSITCRAYVLAALAKGESKIIRPLRADDTEYLLNALCTLGAEARWVRGDDHDGEDVYIKGVEGRFPRGGNLYMGDGGAPTRFMIACACLAAEPVTIDASPRMRERPIAEGVEMLRQLGARIEYVEEEGRLPVRVVPSDGFHGGRIDLPHTQSSQFISALALIAPSLRDGVTFVQSQRMTSESYIDLTLAIIDAWGVVVSHSCFCESDGIDAWESQPSETEIPSTRLQGKLFCIEPDASSAVYWMVAAGIAPKARAYMPLLRWPSSQPDMQSVDALDRLGIDIEAIDYGFGVQGPHALRWGLEVNAINMPDASLALAAAAVRCEHPSEITGLRTLRVKETDRIAALANELRRVGCTVQTGDDWIEIDPPKDHGRHGRGTGPVIIETYNDHRMAMSFAVLGLVRPGISIRNPKCVAKSYPTFWKDFAKLYQ